MTEHPTRVVMDSMLGLSMEPVARWSSRVCVVLGLNPGPFTGPGTNTYLVGTGPLRLLVDTGQGVAEYLPLLESALRDIAHAEGIEGILLTHAHPDHMGGLDTVLSRFGPLPVWKMPGGRPLHGIRELRDGEQVATEGATLEAVWTPGHAEDHLCFRLLEENALFTGDVVLGAGTTVIPSDGDLGAYLDSLYRLQALNATVIYPAHGPAICEPDRKIGEYIAHRMLREQQIIEQLREQPQSLDELVAAIYTDVPVFLHGAAGMSVHAHLRKLRLDGVVRETGGVWGLRTRSL